MSVNLHWLVEGKTHVLELAPTSKIPAKEQIDVVRPLIRDAKKLAGNAVCFDMGSYESMIDLEPANEHGNIPYQTAWFEITFPRVEIIDGFEIEQIGDPTGKNSDRIRVGVLIHQPSPESGMLAYVFQVTGNQESWGFCGTYSAHPGIHDLLVWPAASDNAANAARAVATFLKALRCDNVSRVEHCAPRWIQMQRRKQKKKPLFSYWTLQIDLSKSTTETVPLGGSHASPRVHLRRGHARQYAPGKWTWVQPHAVGNKALGMVHKDYAVKSAEKWGQQ